MIIFLLKLRKITQRNPKNSRKEEFLKASRESWKNWASEIILTCQRASYSN